LGAASGPRVLIDACVLFPTVMREVVLGCATARLFTPFWSDRILREWAGAAARRSPGDETVAKGEIALCCANWPDACLAWPPESEHQFYLPDRNDRHVLAAAVAGHCAILMTMNLRDFPRATLADYQITPAHPDQFLRDLYARAPTQVGAVVAAVRDQAQTLSGQQWPVRKLLKKARLPRLGKALEHLG
jgi:PIN domain